MNDPKSVPETPSDVGLKEVEHHRTHHGPTRKSPFLPPVPRKADNMISKLVEQPLEKEVTPQHELPFRTDGLVAPVPYGVKKDLGYSSTQDPFLHQYWTRKEVMKKRRKLERLQRAESTPLRKRNDQQSAVGSSTLAGTMTTRSHSNDRIASEHTSGSDSEDERDQASDRHRSQRRVLSPGTKSTGSQHRSTRFARAAWNVSNFPLNEAPLNKNEFLCLKTILAPKAGFETKVKTPNCDLNWIREKLVSNKMKIPHLYNMHTAKWDTLLVNDSYRYSERDSYGGTVINSPRSTVVLLRNGIQPYQLLKRPEDFYIGLGEVVEQPILDLRVERAERQRNGLLQSLCSQYDEMCQLASVEDVLDLLSGAGKVTASVSMAVEERYNRDLEQMQFIEERSKKMAEDEMKRRDENAKKMMAMEETLHRKAEEKKKSIQRQAEAMKEQMRQKKRIQTRIQQEQLKVTLEQQAAMEHKREVVNERTKQHKKEQHDEMMRKAMEAETLHQKRVRQAKEREEERKRRLMSIEERKQERAELRRQQQEQEREELRQRQEEENEKRALYKERAESQHAALVEKIEHKLAAGEQRSLEFQLRRAQMNHLEQLRHLERQKQIEFTKGHADRIQEERREQLLRRAEEVERRLDCQKRTLSQERTMHKEEKAFYREEKHEVVNTRLLQEQFTKLFDLSMMEERDSQIDAYKEATIEATERTRQMRGNLRLEHDEAKEEAVRKQIELERETASKAYEITNPKFRYRTPYPDVAPRTDFGQHSKSVSPDRKKESPVPQNHVHASTVLKHEPTTKEPKAKRDKKKKGTKGDSIASRSGDPADGATKPTPTDLPTKHHSPSAASSPVNTSAPTQPATHPAADGTEMNNIVEESSESTAPKEPEQRGSEPEEVKPKPSAAPTDSEAESSQANPKTVDAASRSGPASPVKPASPTKSTLSATSEQEYEDDYTSDYYSEDE